MRIVTVMSVMQGIMYYMSEKSLTRRDIARCKEAVGNTMGEVTLTDFDW